QRAEEEDYYFASVVLHGYALTRQGSWTAMDLVWVDEVLEQSLIERNLWSSPLRWVGAKILRHVAYTDEHHRYARLMRAKQHVFAIRDDARLPIPILLPGTRSEIRDERVLEGAYLDPPIRIVPTPERYKLAHGIAVAAHAKKLGVRELGHLLAD